MREADDGGGNTIQGFFFSDLHFLLGLKNNAKDSVIVIAYGSQYACNAFEIYRYLKCD